MYVDLDVAGGRSHVREATDLKHFSVRVSESADDESLSRALGSLGQLASSDHAWIDIAALRAASGCADDPGWSTQFAAMVAYATTKGWVDPSGRQLRAHLEFPTATG